MVFQEKVYGIMRLCISKKCLFALVLSDNLAVSGVLSWIFFFSKLEYNILLSSHTDLRSQVPF